jgi:hypothetical protein
VLGELLKNFFASCNVTVVQRIFLVWAEHYQALWNGQLHRLVCSNDVHSVSRFFINPDTLYFSIIMIKFYLHLIDTLYYKALEHTMDCIGNKKVCVCVCVRACTHACVDLGS